jgi:hypothetical protein
MTTPPAKAVPCHRPIRSGRTDRTRMTPVIAAGDLRAQCLTTRQASLAGVTDRSVASPQRLSTLGSDPAASGCPCRAQGALHADVLFGVPCISRGPGCLLNPVSVRPTAGRGLPGPLAQQPHRTPEPARLGVMKTPLPNSRQVCQMSRSIHDLGDGAACSIRPGSRRGGGVAAPRGQGRACCAPRERRRVRLRSRRRASRRSRPPSAGQRRRLRAVP